MKKVSLFMLYIIAILFICQPSFAQQNDTLTSGTHKTAAVIYKTADGIAINGFDPVAYFTDHKPVKGNPRFSYRYDDAVWQFKNEKHLNMFKKKPDKFMPQYGGFCAYGISHNVGLVKTVPNIWEIVNGKLYLFSPAKKLDKIWQNNPKENIKEGDKEWPKLQAANAKKH